MHASETESRLMQGHAALEAADWAGARRAFEAALQLDPTAPDALEGLGMAAWWLKDKPTIFEARERAYKLYREQNDSRSAARVAIALAEDYRLLRGEVAIARGWHRRAHRLLSALAPASEHGWLTATEADFVLAEEKDPVRAAALAAEAFAIGRALDDADVQMVSLALEGLALVIQGEVATGMPRLDEAVMAATTGEMSDPYAIGSCLCYLISACAQVRDLERVTQWCERVNDFASALEFDLLSAACRMQHAEVLVCRGDWEEAERELQVALDQAADHYLEFAHAGTARLADLRRLQGRRDEAERLLRAIGDSPAAFLTRASLALDAGDSRGAARLAERVLRRVPESNCNGRLNALKVLLRARLGGEQPERAREVLDEIRHLAIRLGTYAARADAAMAEGLCHAAAGDDEAARLAFEDAMDLYARSGVPLEGALARIELARALRRMGEEEAARRERAAAAEVLERLGADAELARAAEQVDPRTDGTRAQVTTLTRRELDVLRHVAEGRTNVEIAATLHLSDHTVKRHVANILAKLELPTRTAAASHAVREGLL